MPVAVQKCLSECAEGLGPCLELCATSLLRPFAQLCRSACSSAAAPHLVSPSSALCSDSGSFRPRLPSRVLCSGSKCFLGGVHVSLSCSCLGLIFDKRRSGESVLHPAIRNIYSKSCEVSPVLTAILWKGPPVSDLPVQVVVLDRHRGGKGSTCTPALRPRRTPVGSWLLEAPPVVSAAPGPEPRFLPLLTGLYI